MSDDASSNQSIAPNQPDAGNQDSVEMSQKLSPAEKVHGSLIPGTVYSDENPRWAAVCNEGVLRVFMSSTFRDMQRERDEFFANAEKKLKDYAKKRGLVLVFVDLRWGLTSEISQNGLVVISCLESINECPYFLCTLGSRYGWSPNHQNPSEWHPETDLKFPYLKEIRGLSVTDYEIVHGALQENAVARRAFFYSRDEEHAVSHVAETEAEKELYRPVNEKDRENQNGLKKKIWDKFCIKPYRTPKELAVMMIEDLIEAIKVDFPEKEHKNPEDMAHEQFMQHRLIGLEGRDTILALLKEKAKQQLGVDNSDITIVGAESGIGKSTIMSGLVRDLDADKEPNLVIVYHFVGCSNLSNYVENLVERVTRILVEKGVIEMKTESEEGKEDMKKGIDYILKLASRNEKKQVVLVIDAFNQFVDSQQNKHVHRLEWLPKKTPKNISIVASTIDTHESCKAAKSSGLGVIAISKLDDAGIKQAAATFFKRYNKTLNEEQFEMILGDREDTGHPLYLRIVLDELRVFGVYEKVDTELHEMLEANGVTSLFNLIMSRWEKKYGENIVRLSICALYVSRIGLDENELDKYLEHRTKQLNLDINHATWKSFFFVLLDSLFVRNGRYAFSHQLLIQSVKERYFEDESFIVTESRAYGLWLLNEYEGETDDKNVVAEICHQMRVSREYEKLAGFLKSEKVVESMLSDNYRFEFFECWRDLNKNGFDHTVAYGEMAKQLTPAGFALVRYLEQVQENDSLIRILEHRISVETDEGSNSKNMNYLGSVYRNLGKNEQALEYYHKSLEIRKKVYGEIHPDVAMSYNNIGIVYDDLGKNEQALEYHQKSLEIKKKVYGEIHPDVADSYSNIGGVYYNLGKNEQALEYHQKSIDIKKKVYGKMHPGVATSYNNIGLVYYSLGKNEQALKYYQKSLEIQKKVYGEMHPDVATSYNNIGLVYKNLGQNEQALEYYQKDLEITKEVYGEMHPGVAGSYGNIGSVYMNLGKYMQALEYYQKSLEIRLKVYGEMHPDVAISYYNMGNLYETLEKYLESLEMFQKANIIFKHVYGESHPHTKLTEGAVAQAQAQLAQ